MPTDHPSTVDHRTAIATAADARWVAALDEFEANLERFADVSLAIYHAPGAEPQPPEPYLFAPDLGPLPPWLQPRAVDLLDRCAIVATELHQVRDVVGAQITRQARLPHSHAYADEREPSYLDEVG